MSAKKYLNLSLIKKKYFFNKVGMLKFEPKSSPCYGLHELLDCSSNRKVFYL